MRGQGYRVAVKVGVILGAGGKEEDIRRIRVYVLK